ncbi:probable non-specific lipid-transfer protein 2 [Brachypodium distachyon]|uniref:probable non-specific lipid-transfer protein 2 n=1 Tax=Brachypodium distachyon TaxID=15368 RepID=UPI0001C75ADF|nr:probable non-specific lipid-transfer protein 2 [Brachypodium distachyon]|eukprot:XP_010227440.1 probable non-specific lipid-transfer protein 2 [Brachypodium distachyon]
MGSSKAVVCALAFVLLLAAETAAGASCDATALSPCVGAIMLGGAVTPGCCARLKAQQGCLCQYARNPSYAGYVGSPRAQGVVQACGLPKPKC